MRQFEFRKLLFAVIAIVSLGFYYLSLNGGMNYEWKWN